MSGGLRQRITARLPGIGWRSELLATRAEQVERLRGQVGALTEERAALRERVGTLKDRAARLQQDSRELREAHGTYGAHTVPPSFRRNLLNLRRNVEALRTVDPGSRHPLLQTARKLRNYRLAASHGIAVPDVLAVWSSADQIDLSAMPHEFVLKSDGGAGGHGVFPLRREGPDTFRVLGEDGAVLSGEDLRQHFREHRASRPPYFVEAFLTQVDGVGEIPDDIKIYAMYGEVGTVMLRRMPRHADLAAARYRYLDADGVDLGADVARGQQIDSTIRLPESFAQLVEVARHLSRAVALPFIRVDVYDTVDGPVLGELTRSPGGRQELRSDQDQRLGTLWDLAQFRLDLDVQAGRPLQRLHGEHPAPDLYPDGAWAALGLSEVVTAPCSTWCG